MMDIALACGIAFLAAAVQGTIGFGYGLTAMALLPMIFEVRFAVPLICFVSPLVSGTLLFQLRRDVRLQKVSPLLLGGAVGLPAGVLFLQYANADSLLLVLGSVVVTYVVWQVTRLGRQSGRSLHRGWGVVAGAAGGALGGALNTSGPPVIMYTAAQPWSPTEAKATLQAYFLCCILIQNVLYAATGLLGAEVLRVDLFIAPAVVAGVWVGACLSRRVDRELFRKMVLGALFLMGVVYIVKGIAAQ